ncbi:sce7726 family protein [Rhizobium sp. BK176]|uniref:sce7726 family protein n=1 Tax=Rhizobium sp. BK176 TaxID=2587071 RepID=UPI002167E962|nr:sce7726 family protein [Rhizobium sp. BK176]MCS4088888.1 ABC-type amino acid transport substrate-binding protein [Rhizobium sp. BK176]
MLDPDIRIPLARQLRPEHGHGRILGEVGLWGNTVRVDLARLTNTSLDGYEIKSAGDTLVRLGNQAQIYGLVFNSMTLVAAARHIDKAAPYLPPWWGLTEARDDDGTIILSTLRPPEENPSASAERIAGLLWKDEALDVLRSLGETNGLSRLRLGEAHAAIARNLTLPQVRTEVFRRVARRRDWLDRHDPFFVGPFRPRTI